MSARRRALLLALAFLAFGAERLAAEPTFLSRQYARCTNCHFSPTGGGLLTPYGRALSREELSTWGASAPAKPPGREHEFAYGLLGDALGPVSLGISLRPSHLDVEVPALGVSTTRNFLMNADVTAAARFGGWTLFAELGRQPRGDDERIASFEHWVGYYDEETGLGGRVGRFLPAYGVRFADHTSFNRSTLSLDNDDQVYGVELSYSGPRHLVQVTLGPGKADGLTEDDGSSAFTASARWQYDLRPRLALVASGLYRDASDVEERNGATGLAVGWAPTSRLTLWVQGDARFRSSPEDAGTGAQPGGTAHTLMGEAAFEAFRGVWLKFSPQLRTEFGEGPAGINRMAFGLSLLPRTHWNIVLNYYRDESRRTGRTTKTFLAQLHLYL